MKLLLLISFVLLCALCGKKMDSTARQIKSILGDFNHYTKYGAKIGLYDYQLEAADAILESIWNGDGETFVLIFSRQSGKDETLANLEAYIMTMLSHRDSSIVVATPTFKPQCINAMMRLEARLRSNPFTVGKYSTYQGYIYQLGLSKCLFFSAGPTANVVGATAKDLLIINEAQDVLENSYVKKFLPMTASTHATKVFSGTSWTSDTLLAKQKALCLAKEKKDGRRRVFINDATVVGKANPKYLKTVQDEVDRLGREHPMIKTQFFCEDIDAQAGMFNARRLALMTADQLPQDAPVSGHIYAFQIDVGGQDETNADLEGYSNPGRDSTTLSIIDVDLSTLESLLKPTYRVVLRYAWQGEKHTRIFGQLKALAEAWRPQHIVIDATGVGEGLWSLLDKAFPTIVIPIKYSAQVKSEIGYGFLAVIETGRFRNCARDDIVTIQYSKCLSEVKPGPQKLMKWGVPDGTRYNGELVHDDYVLADAGVAILDTLDWQIYSPTLIVQAPDVLEEMDRIKE